jgi:Flp pilus assembly protein TadD
MRGSRISVLFAGLAVACLFLPGRPGALRASGQSHAAPAAPVARILVDYPLDGSVFPPEITPPTFLWRDASETAKRWVVEVHFGDVRQVVRVEAAGEPFHVSEIDPAVGTDDKLLQLPPERAGTRTWQPDAATWAEIKRGSVRSPATVVIVGFGAESSGQPVSSGKVSISTSPDPVGAPVFYRDVPLMLSPPAANGAISPLPPTAIPLITWRLRDIAEPQSRTVMEKVPTCINCHSFSRHGTMLGLDLDGPSNDKGLYALKQVAPKMTIRNEDVIRWSSFLENPAARTDEPAVKRFGFMSQVSPDGRYVVTSVGPPGTGTAHQKENPDFAPGLSDRLFSTNYPDIRFGQVFYPMRGILVWYDREAKTLRPLPGADDARFVQTSAFWSPDGKHLVFSRAEARDPYPAGAKRPAYANDPNEPQIQYDLYRIPFNQGRGGKAEPVLGASNNGMSNNFPKVSPDGRWIVFVQNRNGLLMRPDSKLYIVPFAGGKARLMRCNTSLMNSWHTFSPNGRWLAFSSKSRSAYTQLMLTHVDADGNDTPAILVENTTAANRAVNIPEFVDLGPSGLERIDPQATEVYGLISRALELGLKNQMAEAMQLLRTAQEQAPDEPMVHFTLARILSMNGQEREAVEEYRKACVLSPRNARGHALLAESLAKIGDLDGAVASSRTALELEPSAAAELRLGDLLFEKDTEEAYEHLRRATEMDPELSNARYGLGMAAAKLGRLDEAVEQLKAAVTLLPTSVDNHLALGFVLDLRGDLDGAVAAYRKAVELSGGRSWQPLAVLAEACGKAGRSAEAVQAARQALDLALQEHDARLERSLREALERYEREAARTRR